jgi:two-component system, NtrC family, response regulator AtoC
VAGTILIVDDEPALCHHLARALERAGHRAESAGTIAEARRRFPAVKPDVLLLDIRLPDGNGADLLVELRARDPELAVIVMTEHASIRAAVEMTRLGALDYVAKPFDPTDIVHAVDRALSASLLHAEVHRRRAAPPSCALHLDYPSAAMAQTRTLARRAAGSDSIVLLLGESGTGKEHLARHIHQSSSRAEEPFFSINCAALPRELAESELFGHEAGAFTGSRARKRGLLELAGRGTLLLDEIGEIDPALQSKLLTFLDSRTFVRVGGERPISVEARLIVATNRDLQAQVEAGAFRADLYYRLAVFPIAVPPLRDRLEDLPGLVGELLAQIAAAIGVAAPTILPEAVAVLARYSWPGNIRELRNALERAMILAAGQPISAAQLCLPASPVTPAAAWSIVVPFPSGRSVHEVVDDVFRELVVEALRRGRSKAEACSLLGISRHALAHQMKRLGIAKA